MPGGALAPTGTAVRRGADTPAIRRRRHRLRRCWTAAMCSPRAARRPGSATTTDSATSSNATPTTRVSAKSRCEAPRARTPGSRARPTSATTTIRATCRSLPTPTTSPASSRRTTSTASWMSVSAGARVDFHSEYGTFFSPRLARCSAAAAGPAALSVGQGFFASTPLTEETEAAGLSRLRDRRPLEAERGRARRSTSRARSAPARSRRRSSPRALTTRSPSIATSVRALQPRPGLDQRRHRAARRAPRAVRATSSYTYVRSREESDGRLQETPLTPAHSAGLVGMWEPEGAGVSASRSTTRAASGSRSTRTATSRSTT